MAMTKNEKQNYAWTFNRFMEDCTTNVSEDRMYEIMDTLHRHETTLTRINTIECERNLRESESKKWDTTTKKVEELAKELGFKVEFNGDARGLCIKFHLPSKRYNSWDGETWRINW